jgi:hypothetical protein
VTHFADAWTAWRFRRRNRPDDSLPSSSDRAATQDADTTTSLTAQEVYAQLMKDRIAPLLRTNGLIGSGGRFSLKSETHWALLGFQKSAYSDRSEVRFTVNVLVVRRDEWNELVVREPHHGPNPTPTITYPAPVRNERIGQLTEDRADKWWRINPGQDLGLLMSDLQSDLLESALPWMRQQIAASTQ